MGAVNAVSVACRSMAGAGISQARPLLPQLEPKMKIRQFLPAVFTMLVLALASLSATACSTTDGSMGSTGASSAGGSGSGGY